MMGRSDGSDDGEEGSDGREVMGRGWRGGGGRGCGVGAGDVCDLTV